MSACAERESFPNYGIGSMAWRFDAIDASRPRSASDTARNDAPRHDHEELAPPRLERRVREHGVDDAGPERRRI